jgi:hypothetical protein
VTAGQYTNIGSVTADDPTGTQVSDSDPANQLGADPDTDIEKHVNGQDADSATGPYLAVGSTANFTYDAEGSGNVDLTNVQDSDDQGVTLTRAADLSGPQKWGVDQR